MKILFYSSIFKDIDLYINLGIVTITSFKKYNNFKLDWCIISDSNSNLEYIKSKLNFLQDSYHRPAHPLPEEPCRSTPRVREFFQNLALSFLLVFYICIVRS